MKIYYMWNTSDKKGTHPHIFKSIRNYIIQEKENLGVYSNSLESMFSFSIKRQITLLKQCSSIIQTNFLQETQLLNSLHELLSQFHQWRRKGKVVFYVSYQEYYVSATFLWIRVLLTGRFLHVITSEHYWRHDKH